MLFREAELEAFSKEIVEQYGEAGGSELQRLVFSPHSPEIRRLAARLQIPTDVSLASDEERAEIVKTLRVTEQ